MQARPLATRNLQLRRQHHVVAAHPHSSNNSSSSDPGAPSSGKPPANHTPLEPTHALIPATKQWQLLQQQQLLGSWQQSNPGASVFDQLLAAADLADAAEEASAGQASTSSPKDTDRHDGTPAAAGGSDSSSGGDAGAAAAGRRSATGFGAKPSKQSRPRLKPWQPCPCRSGQQYKVGVWGSLLLGVLGEVLLGVRRLLVVQGEGFGEVSCGGT